MKIDGAQRQRSMQAAIAQERANTATEFVKDLDRYCELDERLVIGSRESEQKFALWLVERGWRK